MTEVTTCEKCRILLAKGVSLSTVRIVHAVKHREAP